MRIHKTAALSFALVVALQVQAASAATDAVELDRAAVDHYDFHSLQRGAKLFVNYCQGCHSVQYLRYTRIAEDLNLPPDVAQENLAFGGELFRPLSRAMTDEQAERWFDQARPPDLSLTARSRGADWLYTFLRSFYRDPTRPSGWNNTVFANTAMPHALSSLQGVQQLDEQQKLALVAEGKYDAAAYDIAVADLVNFLGYAAEPVRNQRVAIGYGVMIFLLLLLPIVYLTYREYWRAVK